MGADWEPAPPVSPGSPVSLQVGSVGAGIGIGCGVGIGFGGPLALGSLPVVGQAAQGITAGLGGLLPMLGGVKSAAQAAVKSLGVQGLHAGFGCGVGVGYGFGAGLMLKPSAAEQMMRTGQHVAGRLTRAVSSKLQVLGITQQQFPQQPSAWPGSAAGSGPTCSTPSVGPYLDSAVTNNIAAAAATSIPSSQHTAQSPVANISDMVVGGLTVNNNSSTCTLGTLQQHTASPHGQHQQLLGSSKDGTIEGSSNLPQQQMDSIVAHTLLRHQQEIAQLKKQNKQLRQAVCRLNPKAPLCSAGDGRSCRRGSKGLQDQIDSSDWAP